MKAIHRKRLLKLAEFLRGVKPEQFDMGCVIEGDPAKLGCGSVACAIGHCPIVFPRHWRFVRHNNVMLRDQRKGRWYTAAKEFFQINDFDLYELFTFRGYPITTVTPKMVARKIEAFVREKAKVKA